MGVFMGPTHNLASRMFSAFIRILTGRFRIIKYTGHKLIGDDLKRGTSSVDIDRARLSWVEKKQSFTQ